MKNLKAEIIEADKMTFCDFCAEKLPEGYKLMRVSGGNHEFCVYCCLCCSKAVAKALDAFIKIFDL